MKHSYLNHSRSLIIAVVVAFTAVSAHATDMGTVFKASYEAEAAGKLDEAYRIVNDAAPISANNYPAVVRLAYLKSLMTQYKEAAQLYATAGRIEGKAIEPVLSEQYQYLILQDWDNLDKAAREGVKRDPNNYYSLTRLGYSLYSRARYADAAEQYTKVAALYPLDLDVTLMRGWAHALAGQKNQAGQVFRSVQVISPDNASAKDGLLFLEKLQ